MNQPPKGTYEDWGQRGAKGIQAVIIRLILVFLLIVFALSCLGFFGVQLLVG